MSKILFIGDIHAKPNELEECSKLIDYIIEVGQKKNVPAVCFLGDTFHTHAVIRVEVLHFWKEKLSLMKSKGFEIWSLVGNHDILNSKIMEGKGIHSLCCFDGLVTVIDKPTILGNIGFLPYTHDPDKFIKWCQDLKTETIVVHQTFVGAMYENNFPAPDGVDQDLIPQKCIISGHIHGRSQIGKVRYIGSSRWLIKSDANESKSISIVEFDDKGQYVTQQDFNTNVVCREIKEYTYSEDEAKSSSEPPKMDPKHKNFLTLVGSARWINKEKKQWQGIAEVRSKVLNDKRNQNRVRESEGVDAGMRRFVYENFNPVPGVSRDEIWKNITKK